MPTEPRTLPPWVDSMSDGCSGGAVWLTRVPALRACCVIHDRAYYFGGSIADRQAADHALAAGLTAAGLPAWRAALVYRAVQLGGAPRWRRPGVSWAFGGRVFAYTAAPATEAV